MKIAVLTITIITLLAGQAYAHGGGCRKDSYPGQCCHMDHSTGIVHCH